MIGEEREAGAEAVVKRVPELVPAEVAQQAYYKLDQKAVKVDQQRVDDRATMLKAGGLHLLQVGPRRYAKVVLKGL